MRKKSLYSVTLHTKFRKEDRKYVEHVIWVRAKTRIKALRKALKLSFRHATIHGSIVERSMSEILPPDTHRIEVAGHRLRTAYWVKLRYKDGRPLA